MSKNLASVVVTRFFGINLLKTGSSFSVRASYAVFIRFSFYSVIYTVDILAPVKFGINICLQNGAYPFLRLSGS